MNKRGELKNRKGEVWVHVAFSVEEIHLVFDEPQHDKDGNPYHPTVNLLNGHVEGLYEKERDLPWELDHKMERVV